MKPLRNSRGVSILETMVVMVVSSVLLAAALPSLSSSLEAHRLQSSQRAARNYVRVVRATAVARNADARLTVSANGLTLGTEVLEGGVWTATGNPIVLEGGASVSNVAPQLVFTGQGITNAPTTITITDPNGSTETLSVSILGQVEAS